MEAQKVIDILGQWMDSRGFGAYKDSICYNGLYKDAPQADGTTRDVYTASFTVPLTETGDDRFYFACFDARTEKLAYVFGKQFSEEIS